MLIHAQFTREFKPSLFGRAIVYFGGAPFSHARLLFTDDCGRLKVFHSVEDGVCVELAVPGSEIVVASFPLEISCSLDHFKGIIYGAQGKEYSWWQCIFMGLGIYGVWNGHNEMVCSELQGVILRDYGGVHIPGEQDAWSPKHNYVALVDHFLKHNLPFERYPNRGKLPS